MTLNAIGPQPLEFDDVAISDAEGRRINAVSLRVEPGEILTIMGPSGSGKSSLLAFATGTLEPGLNATGRVLLGGRDITSRPPRERRIGIMFQEDVLFPHLSVGANLAFGLGPGIGGRARRRALVEEALAQADLAGFHDRDPATLSGGQRSRVALMRTLLADPLALALDEPFSKLDVALRAQIRGFVFSHVRERGLPALLVTHDPEDARSAGGPVVEIGG